MTVYGMEKIVLIQNSLDYFSKIAMTEKIGGGNEISLNNINSWMGGCKKLFQGLFAAIKNRNLANIIQSNHFPFLLNNEC